LANETPARLYGGTPAEFIDLRHSSSIAWVNVAADDSLRDGQLVAMGVAFRSVRSKGLWSGRRG
jgi:hypothetical protein